MNAAQFREAMASLPEPPDTHQPPHWQYWRRFLWHVAQTDDVSNFWKWPPVYHTMLVNHFSIGRELLYLQEDWPRWESVVSDPTNEANQRNLIMQASHLRRWELTTNTRVEELESIVEFGGGYGAMALICRRLGFKGRYLIYDLPEFALLQRYFLSQMHVHVDHIAAPTKSDLTIGLYSLSEIPIAERSWWLELSDSYLLLYSGQWVDIDNHAWMRNVIRSHDDMTWSLSQFSGRPDWYAIGYPK